jgi:hypothetical protein
MANTYEFNLIVCHTAGFKALDLNARYEHKNGVFIDSVLEWAINIKSSQKI